MKILITIMFIALSGCVQNKEVNVNQVLNEMTVTEKKVFNEMADIDKVLFEDCLVNSSKSLCFMVYADRLRSQPRPVSGIDPGSAALGAAAGYMLAPRKNK